MKSGNLNFLEPSGPLQACNGTAFYRVLGGTKTICISTMLFRHWGVSQHDVISQQTWFFTCFNLQRSFIWECDKEFFSMSQQPTLGQDLLIIKASPSHSDTHTLCRTSTDEWPVQSRDLYLTTHNTHKRLSSMLPAGFEPTIPVSERPQTNSLDREATGTGYEKE